MSERLPIVDNLCTNQAKHSSHMCELRLAGREERIKELESEPKYVCGNCGARANDMDALCAPGPIDI